MPDYPGVRSQVTARQAQADGERGQRAGQHQESPGSSRRHIVNQLGPPTFRCRRVPKPRRRNPWPDGVSAVAHADTTEKMSWSVVAHQRLMSRIPARSVPVWRAGKSVHGIPIGLRESSRTRAFAPYAAPSSTSHSTQLTSSTPGTTSPRCRPHRDPRDPGVDRRPAASFGVAGHEGSAIALGQNELNDGADRPVRRRGYGRGLLPTPPGNDRSTRQRVRRSQRFPHCAPMHSSMATQG